MAVIGKILGHADQRMTNRYAHLADDPVFAGAEKVADVLSKSLGEVGYEITALARRDNFLLREGKNGKGRCATNAT